MIDHKELGAGLITLSAVLGGLDLAEAGINIPQDAITLVVFVAGLILTMV